MSGAHRQGVATVWLDRAEKGNALSAEAVAALHAAIDAAMADDAVHTLVIRGRGRHFCTGFDLSDLDNETDASLRDRFVALKRDGLLATPEDAARALNTYMLGESFGRQPVADLRDLSA